MNSLLKDITILLLREGETNPSMRERFPPVNERLGVRIVRCSQMPRLFRYCLNRLGNRRRVKIYNSLVNRYRISWVLIPPKELTKKFDEAIEILSQTEDLNELGDYLEFGVYQGSSFLCMYDILRERGLNQIRLFGFDSFEGLPPSGELEESDKWIQGQFQVDYDFAYERLTREGVDFSRAHLIKGFFSDSLNDELIKKYDLKKVSIVMFDCDMHLSTKEALSFVPPLIDRQAIFFFDDWHSCDETGGQKKAFNEFLRENPEIETKDIGTYYQNSIVFHITRKET